MTDILIIGSVAFDTIRGPFGTHERLLGGAATYASIAAAQHAQTGLVGVIGRDFEDRHTRVLLDHQVDLSGMELQDGRTFFWDGTYSDDLRTRQTNQTELNVFANFNPKVPEQHRSCPYLLLGNIDPTLQLHVLEQLDQPCVVADTMNYWIEGKRSELHQVIAKTDILIINEEEARQLGGTHSLVEVARRLRKLGPETLIIKQGEYGALLFHEQATIHVPAFPLEKAMDPTGAGDSFAGGFLGCLARLSPDGGKSPELDVLKKAMVYGTASASICVEGMGTSRLAGTTRNDIETRYQEITELSCF